jgi:hypothetical protein
MTKAVSRFSALAAAAALVWMAAGFPPGGVSWRAFAGEEAPAAAKALFLARTYLVPAAAAFAAMVLFQTQMRLSMAGAPAGVVFLLGTLGWSLMLHVITGLAWVSRPGYVGGMAAAAAVASRVYAVTLEGRRVRIIWRGDARAIAEFQARYRPAARV